MNPSPAAHYFGGSPNDAPGGIPGQYDRGSYPTATPSIFPGTTGTPSGGRGSLPMTNNPEVYNYAFNMSSRDGGRASALGPKEMFFVRNDAESFTLTQDPTVTWLSYSSFNAHLRSNAGRMDYGRYEDGGRLAGDWRFCGVQNTTKAAWEIKQRASDVLPMTVAGRSNMFNIWLATGVNAQKGMYLYLYACRQKIPVVSGAEVVANPSARPADSEGDLRMMLEDDIDDEDAPGMRGRVPQNIRPGALRRDRDVDANLEYAWQIYPYIGAMGEAPPLDLYMFQGSIGFVVRVGQVLWESPVEDDNAPSYANVAKNAIFPTSGGMAYQTDIKRLPELTVLLGSM